MEETIYPRFSQPYDSPNLMKTFARQHQNTTVIGGVQFGDLIEFVQVDMDFVNRVANVNSAALWSLGQAPGSHNSTGSILTNNSTLMSTLDPCADGVTLLGSLFWEFVNHSPCDLKFHGQREYSALEPGGRCIQKRWAVT